MQAASASKKIRDHYSAAYAGTSEWRWLGAIDKANNIVRLCAPYPHKTILEIGAGEGSVLKRLSDLRFGDSLYALEISSSAIEAIRQRRIPDLVECKEFDGYNIPYSDAAFDLAVLTHVVEHLEYPRKLLYEAVRVAKHVFVEVPLEDTLRLKPGFEFGGTGHINFYSPKTIRKLLQTSGLEVLAQSVSIPSYKVHQFLYGRRAVLKYVPKVLFLRIAAGLATTLFTYHCSLVGRHGGQQKAR